MKTPKLSVVVPVYKVEKYLRQCVDSIINQTLEDIEIILVDEGDMDECRAILDDYEFGENKDSRIKTLHEKNGGYGASMNKGFAMATGEYIGIVEADDFVDINMFKDLYEIAKRYDADIVKSDFYNYTTSNNGAIKAGKIAKFKADKVINVKTDSSILRIQPTIWSAIYRRDFLVKNDIKFLETKGGSYQDTSFAFKTLSLAERIVLTPKAYLYYRIDNENSSVNTGGRVYAICNEYTELTNFVNSHPELKEYVNAEKLINQYNAYVWNLKRVAKEDRAGFIDRFAEEFQAFKDAGEFTKEFFKKVDSKNVNMLLNNKEAFSDFIEKETTKFKKRKERSQKFSLKINTSRISIVLFGKQIFAKEF